MESIIKKYTKKIQCNACDGTGLIKNVKLHCANCDSHRCEFTISVSNDEFYKYKYCEFCASCDLSNSNKKTPHTECALSTKFVKSVKSVKSIKCSRCLDSGYYINEKVICNSCKFPHSVCNCVINPHTECSNCCGLGIIE